MKSFGQNVFHSCTDLTNVVIESGVTSLGFAMFIACRNLTSIETPDSVTYIDTLAFQECDGLECVAFAGDAPEIRFGAFLNVTATIYYPPPGGSSGWTEDVMQDYGGELTWVMIPPQQSGEEPEKERAPEPPAEQPEEPTQNPEMPAQTTQPEEPTPPIKPVPPKKPKPETEQPAFWPVCHI